MLKMGRFVFRMDLIIGIVYLLVVVGLFGLFDRNILLGLCVRIFFVVVVVGRMVML